MVAFSSKKLLYTKLPMENSEELLFFSELELSF